MMILLEVGLIGAPGVGKSAAAVTIAGRLSLDVISSPASLLGYHGVAVGSAADYIVNLEVAMLRHHEIQQKRHSHRPYVTEGTFIDSVVYAGLSTEDCQSEVPTSVLRNQHMREMHSAVLLCCMMLDAQPTDNLFYLPIDPEQDTDVFTARVDNAIRETISTYAVPVTTITGPDPGSQILTHLMRLEKHAQS